MPTLSPLALLLIFLAVSAAPPSAARVRILTSPGGSATLSRESSGWWARHDETGARVSFKREGTNLVARDMSGQSETTVNMAAYFDLTGSEDLTRDATIRPKSAEVKGNVTTRVEKDRMVVKVTAEGVAEDATIVWDTRQ